MVRPTPTSISDMPLHDPTVRAAQKSDSEDLCDVLIRALPQDLLALLGRRFLVECFFPGVSGRRDFTTLVLECDGTVQGFIVIANDDQALTRFMLKNSGMGVFAILPQLARQPSILKAVACFLRKRASLTQEGKLILGGAHREIAAFSLRPEARRRGWGRKLFEAGLESGGGEPLPIIACSDVAEANKFYERNGFHAVGVQDRCGRSLQVWARP